MTSLRPAINTLQAVHKRLIIISYINLLAVFFLLFNYVNVSMGILTEQQAMIVLALVIALLTLAFFLVFTQIPIIRFTAESLEAQRKTLEGTPAGSQDYKHHTYGSSKV